ncbi:MAG: type II secretion system protein M [Pseudomonadota bacterium]
MANSSVQELKSWFNSLQLRERGLVALAAVVTLIFVFYIVIWSPLNNALVENRNALDDDKALVKWLQEQSFRARLLQDSGDVPSISGSLTQVVNQTTRGTSIGISRLQPIGDNLQVSIESVPFNELLSWLNNLETRGVIILQSDIVDTDDSGIVQVRRLVLGK